MRIRGHRAMGCSKSAKYIKADRKLRWFRREEMRSDVRQFEGGELLAQLFFDYSSTEGEAINH